MSKDIYKRYWQYRGKTYHKEGFHPTPKEWARIMERSLYHLKKIDPWESMIELGCGTGHCLKLFLEEFPEKLISGMDISSTMLYQAKDYCGHIPALYLHDIRDLPGHFIEGAFDLAFTNVTLIHIPHEDINKSIQSILRIAKAGFFVETTVESGGTKPFAGEKHQFYFAHDYPQLFEELGLQWEILEELDPTVKRKIYYVRQSNEI